MKKLTQIVELEVAYRTRIGLRLAQYRLLGRATRSWLSDFHLDYNGVSELVKTDEIGYARLQSDLATD
jgi:hypothetical protein